jgi:hypothetical protein
MQQPEDLAEVIPETPSPKRVPVDHRNELARGVPEGAFEGVVPSDHVARPCQYWAVPRLRNPLLLGYVPLATAPTPLARGGAGS